jgi:hypothetical protein
MARFSSTSSLLGAPLRTRVVVATLVVASVVPYLNTFPNDFVYDDTQRIVENRMIEDWHRWIDILRYSTRPIRNLTFLVDFHLWGLNPPGWHLTNILLHVCTTLLVFSLLRRLIVEGRDGGGVGGDPVWIAWGAAFLFALHPVHTEAVTSISNRQEMLMSIFLLLSLLLYDRKTWTTYLGSLVMLAIALGSKQFAIIGPLLWLLRDLWCERSPITTTVRKNLPRYAVVLVLAGVLHKSIPLRLPEQPLAAQPPATVFFTISWAFQYYLRLLVWPRHLSADVYSPFRHHVDLAVILGWSTFVLLLWAIRRDYSSRGILGFACAGFLLSWLPFSNIVPLVRIVAERYLYFPSMWMTLGLSYGLYRISASLQRLGYPRRSKGVFERRLVFLSALVLVGSLYAVRTLSRNREWRSAETLWTAAVRTDPSSFSAQYNLGNCLLEAGRPQQALTHQRRAVALAPTSVRARNNLGLTLLRIGDYREAREAFEEALRIDPDHVSTLFNMACVSSREGDVQEAFRWLSQLKARGQLSRKAVEADPDLELFRSSSLYEELVR